MVFIVRGGGIVSKKEVENILSNVGECFIKPSIDSFAGKNCRALNMHNGTDKNTGDSSLALLDMYGKNFVLQERIKCSEAIQKLYSNSVNTFRIITYYWNGRIYHTPVIFRMGLGDRVVDNGGIFIAVSDNGVLGETAFTKYCDRFKVHPDTQMQFRNYIIPNFQKVLQCAYELHARIPQVGCINWDLTLDENENVVFIEANMDCGSIWLPQMAHGKSAFGDNTAEILQWVRTKIK